MSCGLLLRFNVRDNQPKPPEESAEAGSFLFWA